jgi:hypothetical protein
MLDSLQDTMEKINEPLTDSQQTVLAGGLMIWMEAYEKQIIELCAKRFALKEKNT